MTRRARLLALAVGIAGGCDDSTADEMAADTGEDDGVAAAMCPGAVGEASEGAACTRNLDCESGACSIYADAPVNGDAVCEPAPDECATRFTGTVKDFATGEPVPGVAVNLTTAGAAVQDAFNAPLVMQMTSDGSGRYQGTSPGPLVDAPLAVLGLAWTEAHALTASGLAQPMPGSMEYEPGAGLHEVWLVPVDLLASWSDALAADDGIDPAWLPLTEVGAVVGRVRDGSTGEPIAGAQVVSIDGGSPVVRYVADDGTLGGDATGASGEFLLFGTAPVETFAAVKNGVEVGRATLGVVPRAAFVTMLQTVP
jgi:hypothetical protein